jgi:hypothetical protein
MAKLKKAIDTVTGLGIGAGGMYGLLKSEYPGEYLSRDKLGNMGALAGEIAIESAALGAGAKKSKEVAKQKISKKLLKKLGKGGIQRLLLGGLGGPIGLGAAAYGAYDMGKEFFDDDTARSYGIDPDTKKPYFKNSSELRSFLYDDVMRDLKDYEYGPKIKKKGKKTSKSKVRVKKKVKARPKTKKEILKSIGRKKGGKVGRPKGVGCAIKGYGKAMKRGK